MSEDAGSPVGAPSKRLDRQPEVVAEPTRLWPISRALAGAFVAAAVLVCAALFVLAWLLGFPDRTPAGTVDIKTQLDLLKLAFAVVAGVGGIVALVTAYRRQRIMEIANELAQRTQEHAEQVARDNLDDAIERRVTELYGQAAEQLGHDKAAVRLAGLYSLERLAQDHEKHRQAVIDVVCAYLRMPFHYPDATEPTLNSINRAEAEQEKQVRLTAQRLLARHLEIGHDHDEDQPFPHTYWEGMRIDLTGARLIDFDFRYCRPYHSDFTRAVFDETANFHGTRFYGFVRFEEARFNGYALFDNAQFSGKWECRFDSARFNGLARFTSAKFRWDTRFDDVEFGDDAFFGGSRFSEDAWFAGVRFRGAAKFTVMLFTEDALFSEARFSGDAAFDGAQFNGIARFHEAWFDRPPSCNNATVTYPDAAHVWPDSWQVEPAPAELVGAGVLTEEMGRLTPRSGPGDGSDTEPGDPKDRRDNE